MEAEVKIATTPSRSYRSNRFRRCNMLSTSWPYEAVDISRLPRSKRTLSVDDALILCSPSVEGDSYSSRCEREYNSSSFSGAMNFWELFPAVMQQMTAAGPPLQTTVNLAEYARIDVTFER
jgi:hypothetical protein